MGIFSADIRYFETNTKMAEKLAGFLSAVGFLKWNLIRVSGHVGQVRSRQGQSEYISLLHKVKKLCDTIDKEELEGNEAILWMRRLWNLDKVLFHLSRLVESEIRIECLRIYLTEWICRTEGLSEHSCFLLIPRNRWISYLKGFARESGLRLESFFALAGAGEAKIFFKKPFGMAWKLLSRRFRASGSRKAATSLSGHDTSHRVGLRYWHRSLSFDPTERSEFFWLHGSSIPLEEVTLYGYSRPDVPNPEILNDLRSKGVGLVENSLGSVPIKTWGFIGLFWIGIVLKITYSAVKSVFRGNFSSLRHFWDMVFLAGHYAYWCRFFAHHRIRISVGSLNASVAQTLALDSLNGISVSYQFTVANIICPTRILSAGEDVYFLFSPFFAHLWRDTKAPVKALVSIGFVYDGNLKKLKRSGRIQEARARLRDKGAEFILCFLDENTVNRWDITGGDEEAVTDYEFVLKWLLSDPKLGIVFKPKNSVNLFQRLASISPLIEQAEKTGRCLFLTSNELYGNIFPAEAALISDLCVGKLLGSTAAIESQLAGVPTVLLDLEGSKDHPLRSLEGGSIVFESWEVLKEATECYRNDRSGQSDFGFWHKDLSRFDSFRDGQAGIRMGEYIACLHTLLKEGRTKQEALKVALQCHVSKWGEKFDSYVAI